MKNRNTIQKQVVLQYLVNTNTHPTALELYKMIKKDYPNIGQATVYRNLKILEEQNLINVILTKNNIKRYDGNIMYHTHLICKSCGRLIDIEDCENLNFKALEDRNQIKITDVKIVYEGICNECK